MLKHTNIPLRFLRAVGILVAAPILAGALSLAARADDQDKKTKEKKEKPDIWVEIRTPQFVVTSDGGESGARKVLHDFDTLRRVIVATMPGARTGQFIPGAEKLFIAIRTNVSGRMPYDEIYRDYARLILKLSYRNLPPWLVEGYENVYSSLELTDKGARLARPDAEDLSILFESPLLPLDTVMKVDRGSAFDSGGDKHTVFYAESRALVHFLLADPQSISDKSLEKYLSLVEKGGDPGQSARQAFGDLSQLQSRLDAYVRQVKGQPTDATTAEGSDPGGQVRTLSSAELDARIGDFWSNRGRNEDAEMKLEDALMADPSIALAEQSLGFLAVHRKNLDDADQHLAKALQLNPNDGLTLYGQGLAAMVRGGFVGVPAKAVDAFEKSVSLNPNFAPAWNFLASLYAGRPETLRKALADAQKAASLAPGDTGYQSQVAALQNLVANGEDRGKSAPSAPGSTGSSANATGRADGAQQSPGSAAPKSAADLGLRIERKTEPEDKPAAASAAAPAAPPASAPAPPALSNAAPRVYSMVGSITDVACAGAPQIQITLKAQMIVMHLHADDVGKVAVTFAGLKTPVKNPTCGMLHGHTARVSYFLASGKAWDGEIQAVEIRSEP
ncbi:MAG: tetratricopeptide repeat protein [Acidobacteriia bacterium]|nr:tetratricopeptide repeat protein [Terriglobia bacterium]